MLIIKVIILQCFWLAIVLYGSSIGIIPSLLLSMLIVFGNYYIFRPAISIGRFFLFYFYSL